jgi:hypothetical protein
MSRLTTIPNPFRSAIVADPWHWGNWDMVDVPEIHDEAFDLCRRALERTRDSHCSTSILLHGDAGSGKTHLLARLQAWLAGELTIHGPAPAAIFISVRMQTSPQMIWRHLQSRFGEDLLRPTANGRTQLERILLPRLTEFSPGIGEPRTWLERIQREARTSALAVEEAEQVIDALDQAAGLNDRDLTIVLTHFILGRHRRDVRAWLRGESLPEAALTQLGLKIDQEGDPEERARTIILSLCRMTGPAMPIVFCFDQVEALQSHPHDLAGLHRFGQMLGYLHDETQNTLLISCILSIFIDSLNKAIISSDYDRMRSYGHLPLKALTAAEAKRLIEARLKATPGLLSWRTSQPDRFWPLAEEDIDEALRRNINTPRALLSYCADRFELKWRPELHQQRPSNSDFLTQEMEERLERSAATVTADQTGLIIAHGLPLLLRIVDPRWERGATAPLKGIDLVIESEVGRIALSLCNQNNMTTLASHLRRLRDQMIDRVLEDGGRDRYLLVRDVRIPISSQARRTREYREELLTHGFHWIGVTAEMITALDGARCLLSEAKAGDLANGIAAIPEEEVQQWLLANLRTRLRPLYELLEMIRPDPRRVEAVLRLEDPDPEFNLGEDMSELLALHHILSVEYLSMRLDRDPETIEEYARSQPERFGLLSGPPAVIFQPKLEPVHQPGLDESTGPLKNGH